MLGWILVTQVPWNLLIFLPGCTTAESILHLQNEVYAIEFKARCDGNNTPTFQIELYSWLTSRWNLSLLKPIVLILFGLPLHQGTVSSSNLNFEWMNTCFTWCALASPSDKRRRTLCVSVHWKDRRHGATCAQLKTHRFRPGLSKEYIRPLNMKDFG